MGRFCGDALKRRVPAAYRVMIVAGGGEYTGVGTITGAGARTVAVGAGAGVTMVVVVGCGAVSCTTHADRLRNASGTR